MKAAWRVALGAALGCALGVGVGATQPRPWVAEVTLYLPSDNHAEFDKLLKLARGDAAADAGLGTDPGLESVSDDNRRAELACVVLGTRAAATRALAAAGQSITPQEVERFRKHDLQVRVGSGATLTLAVEHPRAEVARALCSGLLKYYAEFNAKESLTNTRSVRQDLERRYLFIARQVRGLEKELGRSGEESRALGDALAGLRPGMKAMLAETRVKQKKAAAVALNRLRQARSEATPSPTAADPLDTSSASAGSTAGDDTLSRVLADEKTTRNRYGKLAPPRAVDATTRVQLERNYEDSSALHRMLLTQHAILRTLERLEQPVYKVVDPLAVLQVSSTEAMLKFAALGTLAGLCLGALLTAVRTTPGQAALETPSGWLQPVSPVQPPAAPATEAPPAASVKPQPAAPLPDGAKEASAEKVTL